MTTYTHKANKNTYTPIKAINISAKFGTVTENVSGVLFEVAQTGKTVEMTNHQISKLLVVVK